jgi:hypothetical protein
MRDAPKTWLLAALFAVSATACGRTGGYQRGLFRAMQSAQRRKKLPAGSASRTALDNSDPKAPPRIHQGKTFDPDNQKPSRLAHDPHPAT